MLFLKQIRAQGFKSFADQTTIDFTSEMIGVVGPNGSGKSNITDAIRWTLGEQSSKSLRGSNMIDIIFSGSSDRKGADFAEVTLVFNNNREIFSTLNTDVVEVTRKYVRKTKESEFYINGERAKMKDVQDLALETGLTKSSISIISQGTISRFVEAKPDDRREIFDDAAGVGKYKKRKKETMNSLIRTAELLSRLDDAKNEVGRRLPSLQKQAEKAQLYKTKIEELEKYEVQILSKDAASFRKALSELKTLKEENNVKIRALSNEISLNDEIVKTLYSEQRETENKYNQLNAEYKQIIEKISSLKQQKLELEMKESQQEINSDLEDMKAVQIKKEFDEKRIHASTEKDSVYQNQEKLKKLKGEYDIIDNKFNYLYDEIRNIQDKISKLSFAKADAERAKERIGSSNSSAGQLIVLNKTIIPGVIGVLQTLVSVEKNLQIAISAAAAGPMQSVVMKTNGDTKIAIDFLKKNMGGRCTFLALDTIRPNVIEGVQREAISRAKGFIGVASELVSIDERYVKALEYALGTIVIVDSYDNARNLAVNTNHKFNIVTLSGERFLPKGAIIGGNSRNLNIFANQTNNTNQIEDIEAKINILGEQEKERSINLQTLKNQKDTLKDNIATIQAAINSSENQIQNWEGQLLELSDQYKVIKGIDLLNNSNVYEENVLTAITKEIASKEKRRSDIQLELNEISKIKNQKFESSKQTQEEFRDKTGRLSELNITQAKNETEYQLLLEKFGETLKKLQTKYHLIPEAVFEMAETVVIENEDVIREKVELLVRELSNTGPINLDAIEEYKTEKERFDQKENEYNEVKESRDKLLRIIADIDIAMETQFKRIIDDVNIALPEAFARLFGGGTAQLIYTDPENILETGVDIHISPPGKKINNLNLLSGGEKSLVALSVLFSILKVRPLPLVILDEAEAPLDQANVERFARYIKLFTRDTQFIIVTHRDGTMENCDTLFGVTMETKGITKIVKLKLNEAKIQSSDHNLEKI